LRGPNEIAPFGAPLPRPYSAGREQLSLLFAKLGRSRAARMLVIASVSEAI
jgi:hypothetical protein